MPAPRARSVVPVLSLLSLIALVACGDGPASRSLEIVGGDRALEVGASVALTVRGSDRSDVSWTSDDTSVATVDASGTVTAVAAGETALRATREDDASAGDAVSVTVHPTTRAAWTHQFGGAEDDVANAVAVSPGGTGWSAGFTDGAVGSSDPGDRDAFVRALDAQGDEAWTRQFGSAAIDAAFGVAADGSGGVVVTGDTQGSIDGPLHGTQDVFVRRLDANGNELWTTQFGSGELDGAAGVAVDGDGRIAVVGRTAGTIGASAAGGFDPFVRVLDDSGSESWTRQFGSDEGDLATGVAFDGDGGVFVAGYTRGPLVAPVSGEADAFVRKYDEAGDVAWTRQFGSDANDLATGIATTSTGGVVVVGDTRGALDGEHAGGSDAYVRAYAADGELRWTRQFGTDTSDVAASVAVGARDRVLVAGDTRGDLDGTYGGLSDAYLLTLDSHGVEVRRRQFGTGEYDAALAVAVDGADGARVAGVTRGGLEGGPQGTRDAFVRAYGP